MIHSPNHVTQLAVALLASSTHVDSEGMPINLAVYKPSLLQHGSVQVIHTLAIARQQDQSASPSVLSPWVTLPVPHCQCFSSSLSHTKNYSVLQSRIMKLDWVVFILYIFPSFFFSSDPYQPCYIEYITDLRPMTIIRILPKFWAVLTGVCKQQQRWIMEKFRQKSENCCSTQSC